MENRYVPLEKQSKKARRAAARAKRGSWYGVKPVTRVVQATRKDKLDKIKKKEVEDYR